MRDEPKDMWDLIAFRRESRIELRDIEVDVTFILGYAVDNLMIGFEGFSCNCRDLSRNSGGEKEGLTTFW